MIDSQRVKDMEKYNVWEEPVLCFVTIEHTREDGTKFVRIQSFDRFDEYEGQGFIEIDKNERIINTFAAPVGTKNIYGQCDGISDGSWADALCVGCEIPHGHTIDWKKEITEMRKLHKVDTITGSKVK